MVSLWQPRAVHATTGETATFTGVTLQLVGCPEFMLRPSGHCTHP
jgi:hypothetical protein